MTGVQIANQCKLIFSEYGWPETLISDNGPCYTSQAFTSVMKSYNVNHITSSLHYPQSNGLAEKYVQIVKSLFYKAKEEGKDFTSVLWFIAIPILQVACDHLCRFSKAAMLDLTCQCQMLLRNSYGIQPEVIRNSDKHAVLPTHDLHVGQHVMFQDSTNKHWYPAVIESLCPEPRSYKITTSRWYYLQENASTSEAFYTSEQELTI